HTCEVWKKKVERLKRVTRKSEVKELNELKKYEEYERTTLNPTYPKKQKIANEGNHNNSEVPGEDQTIRSPKDTKNKSQELKVTNNPRTEEK
ncbi:24475_t:CDS:2, partial [Gigaspora margarita]